MQKGIIVSNPNFYLIFVASDNPVPVLFYDKGTICIKNSHLIAIPGTTIDARDKTVLRAYASEYDSVIQYLNESDLEFVDNVKQIIPSQTVSAPDLVLRDYQEKAIENWAKSSMRGCIVLPTGAGKTILGVRAIEQINSSALVVVPTIDLMDQWTQVLEKYLKCEGEDKKDFSVKERHSNSPQTKIGNLGGGRDDIQQITVATYDSAYLRATYLGNQFDLIIFDEVHHLPAPGYRLIAEQFIAPYRLGLTATIEREDGLHDLIPKLVGGIVFQLGPKELSEKKHLAEFEIERRQVELTSQEQRDYDDNHSIFLSCLNKLGFRYSSMHNLKRLIMMSNKNKIAREGLLARNKANSIALNSQSKISELKKILAENKFAKTIIFTQNNKMVYDLSDKFLIPFITYKTTKEERRNVLEGFKSGKYSTVVTSKVLDEGIDVPDAELAIIVSGTGSGREMIQRLGRILRPKKDGKKAKLVEIISKHTRETNTSAKRITAFQKSTKQSSDANASLETSPGWSADQ